MQVARTAFVVSLTSLLACSSSPPPRATMPPPPEPSTPDHGGVADHRTESGGNHGIRNFDDAKKNLIRLYAKAPARVDLYCGCNFVEAGHGFRVDLAGCGYVAAREPERAERIEWEHAVPAAAFGHAFVEWREGSDKCVDEKGHKFKGRQCARVNPDFSRIEGDLHNLFPVVGEVNGLRGDLPMGLPDSSARHRANGDSFHFGKCGSAVENGVFMPRPEAHGELARAYKYMNASYPELHLIDDAHRELFDRWDAEDPPDAWERERNRQIAAIQGNPNPFIEK